MALTTLTLDPLEQSVTQWLLRYTERTDRRSSSQVTSVIGSSRRAPNHKHQLRSGIANTSSCARRKPNTRYRSVGRMNCHNHAIGSLSIPAALLRSAPASNRLVMNETAKPVPPQGLILKGALSPVYSKRELLTITGEMAI